MVLASVSSFIRWRKYKHVLHKIAVTIESVNTH